MQSYELAISTLSPVHIGTGQTYEPTNYVVDDGTLYEFDSGAAVAAMTPEKRKELLRYVSARPDPEMLKRVQAFFYDLRDGLMARSNHHLPVSEEIEEFYLSRVGQTTQRSVGGEQTLNRLEIERTFFNPVTGQPVIPGSSIKGAARTALLDKLNGGKRLNEREKSSADIQQRLFQYRAGKFELDPLRLMQLSDARFLNPDQLPGSGVHFAVNRKKAPVTDAQGRLRQSQAEQKGLYQLLECLPAMRYRCFSMSLNLQIMTGVNAAQKVPDPKLQFDLRDLVAACNEFYRPILEAELQLLQKRGYVDETWSNTIRKLLKGELGLLLDSGKAFLLRVGRHCGAESVTINGVRDIKIMKGKGQPSDRSHEAKTVWLAADSQKDSHDMLPFGWLLVEVNPASSSSMLEDALKPFGEAASRWRDAQAKRAIEHERVRKRQEDLALKAAEDARRQAESEAEAERVRIEGEQRLALLSPQERMLEEFRAGYLAQKSKGNYQAGGEYDARRLAFFKEALTWNDRPLRVKAAELIRETIKEWSDWPGKKERKKEFKDWLAELESSGD